MSLSHTARPYRKMIQAGSMSNVNGVNTPTLGDTLGADLQGTAFNQD